MEKKLENLELCPVSEGLRIIGGKWRLQIIYKLGSQKKAYS